MVYLGIDVGTTGSKATAIDSYGAIRSYAYKEYEAVRTNEGYAEISPDSVWQTVRHVIAKAAAEAGEPVKAIAVASLGESFVALDKDDRVLRNSMLYADVRGTEEIDDILQKIGKQELFDITGQPISAMYTLNKLLWVKKHEPHVFGKIDKLFLFEDFIAYKLSGVRCIDDSMASRTLFFDFENHCWSKRILDLFGIDAAWLSKPVATGTVIGQLSPRIAAELHLAEDVKLVAGAHDQVCAALGAGVLDTGECVDGIGTSECITAVLDGFGQKSFMRRNNFCIEPYALKGKYVTLAFSTTGASILGWFCKSIARLESSGGQSAFEILEKECPEAPTDLFVLPHFAGSGTPHMDPFSTGALLGLRLNTTRGDIYKACIEGLCFEMQLNAALLKSMGTRLTGLACVGGGSRSDTLLQVKADIMGIPVKRLKLEESGTMALAMLCAAACGPFKGLDEAARQMVKIDTSFEPRQKYHQVYLDKFSIYQNIYKSLSAL